MRQKLFTPEIYHHNPLTIQYEATQKKGIKKTRLEHRRKKKRNNQVADELREPFVVVIALCFTFKTVRG
jgi:hypothetical protein